jgi:hypothetical protein
MVRVDKNNRVLKTAEDRPSPWLVVHANDYIPPIRFSVALASACTTCGRLSIT